MNNLTICLLFVLVGVVVGFFLFFFLNYTGVINLLSAYLTSKTRKDKRAHIPPEFEKALKKVDKIKWTISAKLVSYEDAIRLIPTNYYAEVANGIYDRICSSKEDIRFSDEEIYREHIQNIDFSIYVVVFVDFVEGGDFEPHFHDVDEVIQILSGEVEGQVNGTTYKPGDRILIRAFSIHVFNPILQGKALLLLKKPE